MKSKNTNKNKLSNKDKTNNSVQEKKFTMKEIYDMIQNNIQKDPNIAKHHYMLATLYKIIKNSKLAFESINKCLELEPKNYEFLFFKGDLHEKCLDLEDASKCYKEAITIEPNFKLGYYRLALLLNNESKYDESLNYIEKMICAKDETKASENEILNQLENIKISEGEKTDKSQNLEKMDFKQLDSLAYELKGIVFKRQGNFQDAITAYEKSIELNPNNYNVYYNKAILHQDQGEFENAKNLYSKANECEDIINNNAWVNLAAIYQKEGNMDESIKCFEKAILINPYDFEIIYNLGFIYESNCKWTQSLHYYNLLTTYDNPFSHSPDLFSTIGKCLKADGKIEESVLAYQKALDLDSYFEPAVCGKSNSLCLLGKFDEALQLCDEILIKKSENRDLLINKAYAQQGLNLFEQSLNTFEQLIKIESEKATTPNEISKFYLSDAYCGKALNLMNLNNKLEAIDCFNKAIEMNPKNYNSLWNKSVCLIDLNKTEEAIEILLKFNEIKPDDYKTFNVLASCMINIGNYDEALKKLEKSLELNNNISQTFYYKGVALHNKKEFEEAVESYEKALQIDPNNENAKKMKKRLWEDLRKLTNLKKED